MQKARGQPFALRRIGLPQLAGLRFQVLFHSHSWDLFNFPSRYLCTIGWHRVFSLGRRTGQIRTWFHVSGNTWEHVDQSAAFHLQDYHLVSSLFPEDSITRQIFD